MADNAKLVRNHEAILGRMRSNEIYDSVLKNALK